VSHIYDDYTGYDSCESVDEGVRERVSTAELDAEYSKLQVKIVDLGNALTHSLTHSPTHPLTHLLTRLLTH
jgi:hypothetical protein